MKALCYYAPGDLRLIDAEKPKCGPDTMVLKILSCAICGSDLKTWKIGNPRITPPNIIGHELAGEIIEAGRNVGGFGVGERVTLATTIGCGECYYCREGRMNICPYSKPVSCVYPGAFAEFMEVPALAFKNGNVIKIPDGVDADAAALAEPLSCVVNAQKICGLKPGHSALIVGAGPLGCLHVECAKAFGATKVVVSARSSNRREHISKLGVDAVVDQAGARHDAKLMELTGGLGYDVVIITAPVAAIQESFLKFARKGGCVNLFAGLPKGESMITVDSRLIHYNELRLTGASDSSPSDVRLAVELIAKGRINTDAIITHCFPLDDVFEGLRLMEKRDGLKIIIKP